MYKAIPCGRIKIPHSIISSCPVGMLPTNAMHANILLGVRFKLPVTFQHPKRKLKANLTTLFMAWWLPKETLRPNTGCQSRLEYILE